MAHKDIRYRDLLCSHLSVGLKGVAQPIWGIFHEVVNHGWNCIS